MKRWIITKTANWMDTKVIVAYLFLELSGRQDSTICLWIPTKVDSADTIRRSISLTPYRSGKEGNSSLRVSSLSICYCCYFLLVSATVLSLPYSSCIWYYHYA